MQYSVVFAVVFGIMLAVILLFCFMIRSIAVDVKRQVRNVFIRQTEVFDELCAGKLRDLDQARRDYEYFNSNILKKQEPETEETVPAGSVQAAASWSDVPAARLTGRGFAENYRYVKEAFLRETDLDEGIRRVMAEPLRDRTGQSARVLAGIRKKLSFSIISSLLLLAADEQQEVLSSCLDAEENQVLSDFLSGGGEMDAAAFLNYLDSRLLLENPSPLFFAAGSRDPQVQAARQAAGAADAQVMEDDSICEGFAVLRDGRMYDYSI